MRLSNNDRKLIIFDCDGVLVDSELIVTQFLVNYLCKFNYHISAEAWLKRFIGKTDDKIYQEINLEFKSPPFSQSVIESIQEQIYQTLCRELMAIDGMRAMLEGMRNINQPFCVASSGTIKKINTSLRITRLKQYFPDDSIFSAQSVKYGKPAPDLFLFVARQMAYKPQACIVIEDSLAGINAAKAAGMTAVAFVGASHAKYKWYVKKIKACDVPLMKDSNELLNYLTHTVLLNLAKSIQR